MCLSPMPIMLHRGDAGAAGGGIGLGVPQTPGRLVGVTLIRAYQLTLSSFIGNSCRHLPTCSEYGFEAIARYGLWAGGWLTLFRVIRCGPGDPRISIRCRKASHRAKRWYTPWRYGNYAERTHESRDHSDGIPAGLCGFRTGSSSTRAISPLSDNQSGYTMVQRCFTLSAVASTSPAPCFSPSATAGPSAIFVADWDLEEPTVPFCERGR